MPTAYATDRTDLATQVEEASGQNAYLCFGCKKCTAGCPMAEHLDLTPHRLLRAIQLGQKETVLHSKTIWLCAACEACATRCPQGVDLPRIMDALKIMAQREGVEAAVRPMPFFYDAVLRGVKLFGRMYEPGVMGELYLRMALSGDLDRQQLVKEDVPLAVKMLKEGKLKVVPPLSRSARHHSRLAPEATRLTAAYYPGCSLHATSAEYDQSTRAVAEQIGLKPRHDAGPLHRPSPRHPPADEEPGAPGTDRGDLRHRAVSVVLCALSHRHPRSGGGCRSQGRGVGQDAIYPLTPARD